MARVIMTMLVAATLATPTLAQNYRFPLTAPSGTAPYITAYRDDDASSAIKDFTCGSHSYNGHGGTDIGIGGFAQMDAGSRDIVAGADGTVSFVNDGCFDRCTSGSCNCGSGFGNYVRVDHADGKRTYYGHMKNGTVRVTNGQRVTCGTVLGKVGSSGNSSGPHLHFEVRHPSNASDDPFGGTCGGPSSYWIGQGAYRGLPATTCPGGQPPPPPAPTAGTLRGVVFADTGAGTADMTTRLGGASIVVVSPALSTTAAGSDGAWSFAVATGPRTIRASAPGYQTAERTCDVEATGDSWCSIGLLANPPPPPAPPPPPDVPPPDEPAPDEPTPDVPGDDFTGDDKPETPDDVIPGDDGDGDPEDDPTGGANPLVEPVVTSGCSQAGAGAASSQVVLWGAVALMGGRRRRSR